MLAMAVMTRWQAADMDGAADQVGDPCLRGTAHPSVVTLSEGVAKAALEDGFAILCWVWLSETFVLCLVGACAQLPVAHLHQFLSPVHVWHAGTLHDFFLPAWKLLRLPALAQSDEIVDKQR